jgi:hypothetical protein
MSSSTISNIVFQGVDKSLICFDTIDIIDLGISSYKNDSSDGTIINSRDIGVDDVTSNSFMSKRDVQVRIG